MKSTKKENAYSFRKQGCWIALEGYLLVDVNRCCFCIAPYMPRFVKASFAMVPFARRLSLRCTSRDGGGVASHGAASASPGVA